MRSPEEVREAIAILGTSVSRGELRRHIWGPHDEGGAGKAIAMMQALCWVTGASAGFDTILDYVQLKLTQYTEQENEEANA